MERIVTNDEKMIYDIIFKLMTEHAADVSDVVEKIMYPIHIDDAECHCGTAIPRARKYQWHEHVAEVLSIALRNIDMPSFTNNQMGDFRDIYWCKMNDEPVF